MNSNCVLSFPFFVCKSFLKWFSKTTSSTPKLTFQNKFIVKTLANLKLYMHACVKFSQFLRNWHSQAEGEKKLSYRGEIPFLLHLEP
jgi:hypothetical protein